MNVLKSLNTDRYYVSAQLNFDEVELDAIAARFSSIINITVGRGDSSKGRLSWQHGNMVLSSAFEFSDWLLYHVGSDEIKIVSNDDVIGNFEVIDGLTEIEFVEQKFNEPISAHALTDDGMMLNGTNITTEFATSANDETLEIAVLPTVPGKRAIGPSNEGLYYVTVENDTEIGLLFSINTVNASASLKDLIELYDINILVDNGASDALLRPKLNKDDDLVLFSPINHNYVIDDSYVDEQTLQNGTRTRFLADHKLMFYSKYETLNKISIHATHKVFGTKLECTATIIISRVQTVD